jgi:hypothetical protein
MKSWNKTPLLVLCIAIITMFIIINMTEQPNNASNLLIDKSIVNYNDYENIQVYFRNKDEINIVTYKIRNDILIIIQKIQELNGNIDEQLTNVKEKSLLEVYITKKGFNTETPIVLYKDSIMFKNNIRYLDEEKISSFIDTISKINKKGK